MNEREEKLKGGQSGDDVIRIGDTVCRKQNENSSFVHKLLLHLEKESFDYSPRFLGVDEHNREILSYLDGNVPRDESELKEENIFQAINILRIFHDATSKSELVDGDQVVCHNDFAPWNVVFDDKKMIGIIDFNDAKPGRRVDDVVYALWTFLGLGDVSKTTEHLRMITKLVDTYGDFKKEDFIEVLLNHQRQTLKMRKNRAQNDTTEKSRQFSAERAVRIEKEIQWTIENTESIRNSLGI